MATQTINFNDVQSVKFNGNDVESIKFNGNQIWEKQTTPVFDSTFGNNSWATISAISQIIASQGMTSSQVYSNYGWQLGDTKSITLSTNEVIDVQIIGFNHDVLSSDHSSKAGITLQMVDLLPTRYKMNNSSSNAGGWNASAMRTTTLPAIKLTLPSGLQSVLKMVDKKAANGGSTNYSATVTSSDDLFLLSTIEIFGFAYGAQDGANEGTQYEYWVGKSADDRIKRYTGTTTATNWWLRSSLSSSTSNFSLVNNTGAVGNNGASNLRGVAFSFCV